MSFSSIPDALKDLRAGRALIVVDDASRENEGDIVVAAEKTTPAHINFMIKNARGLVCVPMEAGRLDTLGLDPMVSDNSSQYETAFTVSVDAKKGVTTGISAQDRWRTIRALVNPRTRPVDLSRPGHLFPLRYKEGGVLVRTGHTEAAVDLARLAGLQPAAVICEIVDEDGTMARGPRLAAFARKHRLKIITIADLVSYRRGTEKLVRRVSTEELPTRHGRFTFHLYEDIPTGEHHAALVMGDVAGARNVLVRVHSSCFVGNVIGSTRCECGRRWDSALRRIAQEGRGVALYMHQEGGRTADCRTPKSHPGAHPGLREYGLGAQILTDLGLSTVRLLTNHPQRIVALDGYGLKVVGAVPT